MKNSLIFLSLMYVFVAGFAFAGGNALDVHPKQEDLSRQMNITGKIALFEKTYLSKVKSRGEFI